MKNLSELRSDIDKIDQKIILLIKKRLKIAKEIGKYKKENKLPVKDSTREREILEKKISDANSLNLSPSLIRKVFLPLLSESRKIQK